ncbi:MAG: glyoxalase/bleomycin resistance/extradiol dioxygenase family protein [Chitinophagaceae bacterium]|nr:MAG: glyoxalase/bleomycin resistance/extradiol dioxygenase family protein [Chitinophagaceae bacterium]
MVPYLNFNGNAAEALDFYSKALGGSVTQRSTFGEANMAKDDSMKDKILHAVFEAGNLKFMVSDCPPGVSVNSGDQVSLSLNFPDLEGIEKTFAALAEGGNVTMPIQDTFWGARFAMTKDKFGVLWMFNHDYPKTGENALEVEETRV